MCMLCKKAMAAAVASGIRQGYTPKKNYMGRSGNTTQGPSRGYSNGFGVPKVRMSFGNRQT